MWRSTKSPAKLYLLALSVLAACSVDLSKLRAPHSRDAALDSILPMGGAGGNTADAENRLDESGSTDLPTIGSQDTRTVEGVGGSSSPGGDASTDEPSSGGSGGAGGSGGVVDGAGGSGAGGATGGVDGAGGDPAVDVRLDQTVSTDDGSTGGADAGGAMGGVDGEGGTPSADAGTDQTADNSDAVITLDTRDAPEASGGETGTDGGTGSTLVKLTGTTFGTGPSYYYGSNTFDKVFDGDISTYDDDSNLSGGYAGIDLGDGVSATVAVIRYYPRQAWNERVVGGKFQCSTTSQTNGYSDLYTITAEPPLAWTQVTIARTTPCRYLRYLGPTNGSTNIAEIEFWGVSSAGGEAGAPGGGNSLVNLAYKKPTMASSQASNYAAYGNDGLLTSEFCPSSATFPAWWLVDLGAVYTLVETDINFEHFSSFYKYKIDVSRDSTSWTTTVDHSNNTIRRGGTMTDASNVQARYVRLTISGSSGYSDWGCFWELLVWGYRTPF